MVTNYGEGRGGGYKTGRGGGGQWSFTPTERRETKCLRHAEGGGDLKSFEVVLTRELEVSAILIGGHTKFPPFKRWRGGEKFGPAIFPFCSPPPPPSPLIMTRPLVRHERMTVNNANVWK